MLAPPTTHDDLSLVENCLNRLSSTLSDQLATVTAVLLRAVLAIGMIYVGVPGGLVGEPHMYDVCFGRFRYFEPPPPPPPPE